MPTTALSNGTDILRLLFVSSKRDDGVFGGVEMSTHAHEGIGIISAENPFLSFEVGFHILHAIPPEFGCAIVDWLTTIGLLWCGDITIITTQARHLRRNFGVFIDPTHLKLVHRHARFALQQSN